jgi:hypothetical protein
MLRTNIPNPYPLTKRKRLSPHARDVLTVLKAGGSVVRHAGKVRLFDHRGSRHLWFTSVHLKELHACGLVEPACYVAHAPTEWTLTARGRMA